MAKGRFVCHLFKGENIQTYYTKGGIVLKTLIVYASIHHGNTEKIGKEIATQKLSGTTRILVKAF